MVSLLPNLVKVIPMSKSPKSNPTQTPVELPPIEDVVPTVKPVENPKITIEQVVLEPQPQVEGNVVAMPLPQVAVMPTLTQEEWNHVAALPSVSKRIKWLWAKGFTRSQIAKSITNAKGEKLLYQHVNNVLGELVKKPRA